MLSSHSSLVQLLRLGLVQPEDVAAISALLKESPNAPDRGNRPPVAQGQANENARSRPAEAEPVTLPPMPDLAGAVPRNPPAAPETRAGSDEQLVAAFKRRLSVLENEMTGLESEKNRLTRALRIQTATNALRPSNEPAPIAVASPPPGDRQPGAAPANNGLRPSGEPGNGGDFGPARPAAAIEDFFNSQADPYHALFQQIHSAVIAGKAGQDRLAAYWTARFQQLEEQLRSSQHLNHR